MSTQKSPLLMALQQMYRADLLKIAAALGCKPRANHYRGGPELIQLIVKRAGESMLKDDWLLRVEVPWTMYKRLPCLDELKYKTYEQLSVETLREICRQYSISGFTKIPTKVELVKKVREMVEDTKDYPRKIYRSRITKEPIPEEELIMHRDDKK